MKIKALLLTALLAASCESPDSVGTKDTTHSQGPPVGFRYTTNPVAYPTGVPVTSNPTVYDSGAPIDSYSISPATLPAGLSFSTTTGEITGTPTALADSAQYTVTAYNHYGSRFVYLELRTTNAVATHLAFTVSPSNTVAGATVSPTIQVSALAANGSVDSTFSSAITLAIGTNPGTGQISGTTTVTAASGVATFTGLSINKVGTGYTLSASSPGLTAVTSSTFNITAGPATHFGFSVQPSNATAGAAISPAIQVSALDALGNVETTFSGPVTVAIGTNAGGGTLSGTTVVGASSGVASFANLSIDKAGAGYTLTASGSVTSGTSAGFAITAGTATQLAFGVEPPNGIAGATLTPAPSVKALDAFGNFAASFNGLVTVSIATNPGGGALSGTLTFPAISGTVTFSNLSINKTGTGYTLSASATGLTAATSTAFNITAATPTHLGFVVQPSNAMALTNISPAIQIGAFDANGNAVNSYATNITVAFGANPGTGTLSGTLTQSPVAGVASFSNLSIDKKANGYTLTATSGTLTAATSTTFNITAGAATQLKFTVEPTNTTAGNSITPSVVVTAFDSAMNIDTTYSGNVTVAIASNPGSGTLSGTKTVAAVSGVATFSNLSINKAAAGYTISAISGLLTGDTSSTFTIVGGSAATLSFTVQPSNAVSGAAISPAIQVTAYDSLSNVAASFSANVTLAISANPGGGTLSGTLTVAASSGVATFAGINIDKMGTGYTLAASSAGLTSATSSAFNIIAGSATQLAFTVQPTNTVAAAAIAAPRVTAYDASMNVATTFTGNVTIGIGTNPGGGSLTGTVTLGATSGVVNFPGLSINKSGTGYTLTASSGTLATGTSSAFNITAASATQVKFSVQPVNTASAANITPAVHVTAFDNNMNIDTSYVSNVTVAIASNPGAGTLSGTVTVAAVAGVATFSTLNINKAASGYTLSASSGALVGDTSSSFTISPAVAAKVLFTVQPSNTIAGASISPSVQVTAYDAASNVVTTYSGNVTLSILANPGGGTLSGTLTVAASSGVATFANLGINKVGTGYTLKATSGALTTATSSAFNILAGTATQLAFTVQPSNTVSATSFSPQPQVTAYDANMNVATGYTSNVTLSIGTNPGGGSLSGSVTVPATAGVATFPGLSIGFAGTGYTLTAASGTLTGATSSTFNITAGVASQLAFSTQPTSTLETQTITPAVTVAAEDAQGNVVSGYSGNITLGIGTNAASGTLSGTLTVAAFGGTASFNNLSINNPGAGYTLTAAASSLAGATSTSFNIVTIVPTKLIFHVQPANTTDCASISPSIVVYAVDGSNNLADTYTGNVTLSIGTNPGGGTLSGTLSVAASAGVATFSGLSIDKPGTAYTLSAASGGLASGTSASFNIVNGPTSSIAFVTEPSDGRPTAVLSPSMTVSAYDSCGQIVSGYTSTITLSFGTNPTGATLGGTAARAAVAGTSTFNDITVSKSGYSSGGDYTLSATDGTFTATSTAFNVGIDLAVPIELLDTGVSSSNSSAITFGRSETGFDLSKYDGTLTYSSEAICTNVDSVTRNLTIVDQGGTTRGQIAVPATGTATYLTGTFSPVGSITSLKIMLDQTTSADQLVCTMARVVVRQQYATKTRVYIPLSSLVHTFSSNVDVNNAGSLNATTTPVATNSGGASTSMTNPERTHRITFDTANYGNTIVGYSLEAVCSSSSTNRSVAELYDTTGSADVTSSQTSFCPKTTLGLASSTWTTDGNWISLDDYEIRVLRTSGFTAQEWLYKGGLWIEVSDLEKALVMYRVGKYASETTSTVQTEQGAVINTSYFNGVTNSCAVNFEASGRDPVNGTATVDLYDSTLSSSVSNSPIDFNSTVKARMREGTALNLTDGDQYTSSSTISSGSEENSGTFVVIQTQ